MAKAITPKEAKEMESSHTSQVPDGVIEYINSKLGKGERMVDICELSKITNDVSVASFYSDLNMDVVNYGGVNEDTFKALSAPYIKSGWNVGYSSATMFGSLQAFILIFSPENVV